MVIKICPIDGIEFDDDSLDGRHDYCPKCEQEQWDDMVRNLKDQGFTDKDIDNPA